MSALHTVLAVLVARTASAAARTTRRVGKGARDAGASALEFAIIAAIVVVAASVIGAVIYNIVDTKSDQLDQCANQPIGSAECAP
jgi:Flp pilus assembly pilin Flp